MDILATKVEYRDPDEDENHFERQLHQGQAEFSRLLGICKALYPLAEEILWSSIHIFVDRVPNETLVEAALGVGASRRPRGQWTQELWVTFIESDGPPQPWSIHTLFTDLREYTLNMYKYRRFPIHDKNLFRTDDRVVGWASRITALSIRLGLIQEEGIRFLADWFTSLQRLTIWDDYIPEPEVHTVSIFPVLRHLSLTDGGYRANHFLMVMNTPRLESLCVGSPARGSGVPEFISGAKDTLISLSADPISFVPIYSGDFPLTSVIYALPKLQTLTAAFDLLSDAPSTIHPELLAMQGTVFPLEELHLLVYYLLHSGHSIDPEELSKFLKYCFPSDWFPRIKRVVLRANEDIEDTDRAARLKEAAQAAMPQAEVTWLERAKDPESE
ncbi:hypothetical protein FRC17_004139 [Serendipita sp. 399]|nr:hypothetical protein FRC17_004139 [Serendipita sp. 399]